MKFLIFSYYNKLAHHGCSFDELAKTTIPTYKEYCEKHGYDFYCKTQNFTEGRTVGWSKFEIFLENMDKYDWMFYVECDSMLMNQTIRLENLIDNHHDIIMTKTDTPNTIELNCGPMLVKSSEWNKKFFEHLLNKKEYYSHQMVEQAAISDEVNQNEEARKHFKIMNLRFFNSYYHEWHPNGNYKHGDFILHLAGTSNSYREKVFKEMKDNIIKSNDYKISCKPFLNIGDENIQ